MSTFLMSDKYPCFCQALEKMGHRVVSSDTIGAFLLPEQKHADMQILNLNGAVFLQKECTRLIEKLRDYNPIIAQKSVYGKYPSNVSLNFLYFKNKLYGKISAIEPLLRDYCNENGIEIVDINQGYARCSTLVISENAAITADSTVYAALKQSGADVLKIDSGNIALDGFDYGFIGGAGGRVSDNLVVFFGNLSAHPQSEIIIKFCNEHNVNVKCLCAYMPLTDVGGMVELYEK